MITSRPTYRLIRAYLVTFIIFGSAATRYLDETNSVSEAVDSVSEAASVPTPTSTPTSTDSVSADTKFERLNKVALATHDLTADYVEEKFSVMLTKPLVSTGRVFVKGDRTRWHTMSPHDSTLFTNQSEIAIYFPERKVMEVYAVDRRLRSLVVSPVPNLDTIREQFSIEIIEQDRSKSILNLRLTPLGKSLSDYIEEVRVTVDMTVGLAKRVEMIDPTGDRTVVTFTNIRTNVGLTDSDVARHVPVATTIIRPMEPEKNRDVSTRSVKP